MNLYQVRQDLSRGKIQSGRKEMGGKDSVW